MPLIIALWLLSQPLVVQAPINGLLTERLITIQGNSVVGATSHLNPPRFNSLGVLGDFTGKVVVLHELELAAQKSARTIIVIMEQILNKGIKILIVLDILVLALVIGYFWGMFNNN